jgi:hypothetical protein
MSRLISLHSLLIVRRVIHDDMKAWPRSWNPFRDRMDLSSQSQNIII